MKSKILLSFFSLLIFATVGYAQTAANMTTANVDMHYSISSKANTAETIVIDASMVTFKSTDIAKNYFNAINDNLLSYRYDGSRYVYLTLNHYEGTPTKTVEEWNTYISHLFTRYAALLTEMNK